ncbi:hypothetical protein RHMOL_Rhmol13G0095100 [Rhododendron molle]|uniref:Uncharacterized protein n=1 Tax=Rhododendron molle TaxID=49168 RepID=A0ACC0L523_RHOML|nr:hypothetical protein RHMOL_Rhmol13G0095100 [Rhododendron molle]
MKAKNRRTEMMVETPSPPLEATICSEFSTGFASTGKASPETAEVFQNWALFGGISRRGVVLNWMALFEVSERDESLWVFSGKKRASAYLGEASAASSPSVPPPFFSISPAPLPPFSSSPLLSVSPLSFEFLVVWPARGTLADGLRFSLDFGSLWVSRSVGLRSAVEFFVSGLVWLLPLISGLLVVASEMRWTVNSCPSVARASGSLLFGVASSPAKEDFFEFLLRGFAGDLAFGLLYWGRQISLCCIDHFD